MPNATPPLLVSTKSVSAENFPLTPSVHEDAAHPGEATESQPSSGDTILVDSHSDNGIADKPTTAAPETAIMISMVRQEGMKFARDINSKLDDFETQVTQLASRLGESHDSLREALDELHTRTGQVTGHIGQIADQLQETSTRQKTGHQALDERLRTAAMALGARLDQLSNTLSEQQLQLGQLDAGQGDLQTAQSKLEGIVFTQNQALESLERSIGQQFQDTQADLAALHRTQGDQHQQQQDLAARLDHLDGNLNQETAKRIELERATTAWQLTHHKHFKIATASLCGLTLTIAGIMTWLHMAPNPALDQVQQELAQLKTTLDAQLTGADTLQKSLTNLSSRVSNVESALTHHREDNARVQADIEQLSQNIAALRRDSALNQTRQSEIDQTLAALQVRLTSLQARVTPPRINGAIAPVLPIQNQDWLARQAPDNYSIQLVGVYREANLATFVNENAVHLRDYPLASNRSQLQGRDWYNLYYGNFSSFSEAQRAITQLPPALQNANPWIRQMDAIVKSAAR